MANTIADALRSEQAVLAGQEQARAMHRKSARVFFDTLEALYPPENTEQYWERATDTMVKAYAGADKPLLLNHLLVAMMEYLEDVVQSAQKG